MKDIWLLPAHLSDYFPADFLSGCPPPTDKSYASSPTRPLCLIDRRGAARHQRPASESPPPKNGHHDDCPFNEPQKAAEEWKRKSEPLEMLCGPHGSRSSIIQLHTKRCGGVYRFIGSHMRFHAIHGSSPQREQWPHSYTREINY